MAPKSEAQPSGEERINEAPAAGASGAERLARLCNRAIRAVAFAAACLVPVFFLPFTPDALLAKVVLIESAALVLAMAWLLQSFARKRLSYRRMPLNAAMLAAAVTLGVGTVSSGAPWASFWGSDPTGEKSATLFAFFIFTFVLAAVLNVKDVRRAAAALLFVFGLLGAFAAVLLAGGRSGLTLPSWLAVNPAGTANALALVLGIGFIFSAVLALAAVTSARRRALGRRLQAGAALAALLQLAALMFLGFPALWWGIALALALMLAFNFTRMWRRGEGGGDAAPSSEHALGSGAAVLMFFLLTLGLFFAAKPPAFPRSVFQPPLEISPSLAATINIDAKVLRQRPLLGMGPANFRLAFSQFRDPSLNATPFWQARFAHGFSLAATLPATLGLLGAAAFLALIVTAIAVIARALWYVPASDPYRWAIGAAAALIIIEWFLFTPNVAASFLLFLFLGLLGAMAREMPPAGTPPSWWRITRRTIAVEAPAFSFVTSLATVFAAAFSLVALYAIGAAYAAEVYFQRGARALDLYGNSDTAAVFFGRAITLNPNESSYYLGRVRAALVAVSRIITQAAASPTPELSAEFRSEFSNGVNAANAAADLAPLDREPRLALGQLYEAVIPFLAGADRAAADAYGRASRLDPVDPALKFFEARALVAATDVASAQAAQASAEERRRLEGLGRDALASARAALESAISLKPDFAPAHFLLAQTYLREGNMAQAVGRVEATAVLAPADIGVAFQLGFLYYRSGEFTKAEREFQRAVLLNDTYSNARYFLGLIYERKGDRDGALSQFQKISALNPDNAEVKRIIANIKSGRRALDGITPPEARRAAPISDGAPAR